MTPDRPRLESVLETVLYFTDQSRCERFYGDVLGMRLIDREPGRSLFFRAGDSVFLLFDAEATSEGGPLPAHGSRGPGHCCFLVAPEAYESWKTYLRSRGVGLIQERSWQHGRRSFYFRDPDDNLLEIADGDIWPS
jgi:catechol 2,3-dioxygenase-like lactoylglutathione lyase family enzyme